MFLQHIAVLLLVLLASNNIDICFGQIVFPKNVLCTTPDGERGNCVRWSRCLSLSQTISDWEHLRPHLCGFAGTEPKVCCLSSSATTPHPTTSKPRIPNSTAGQSVPRINLHGLSNKSEEKPTFLPDNCGSSIFILNKVIGGHKAEKGNWPWMVVIFKLKKDGSKNPDCGGALVTARHVVTAAHCVTLKDSTTPWPLERLMVRAGIHDLTDENDPDAIDIGVDEIRIHENYDHRVLNNDIAVLRLSQTVPFSNYTAPVCLPYDSLRHEDISGKSSTITGFGWTTTSGPYSDVLMEVSFDIQDQETCRRTYERTIQISNNQLCAGSLDGSKDSCVGDSGGPLVTVGKEKRYYLVGIVSFGKLKCAEPGYPGVYTRVTEYLDWLTSKLAD